MRHHRRRASAGAAAHAGGDEHHVGAFQASMIAFAVFQRGLPADFRVGAGAEALVTLPPRVSNWLAPQF